MPGAARASPSCRRWTSGSRRRSAGGRGRRVCTWTCSICSMRSARCEEFVATTAAFRSDLGRGAAAKRQTRHPAALLRTRPRWTGARSDPRARSAAGGAAYRSPRRWRWRRRAQCPASTLPRCLRARRGSARCTTSIRRHLGHPRHSIVVEVALDDAAAFDRDRILERRGQPRADAADDLLFDNRGIDDLTAVDGAHDAVRCSGVRP